LPVGGVSRAPGDAAVRQAAAVGLYLDEWEQLVLRDGLAVRADGKWAAFSVCLIAPRQNGKGAVLEALALAAMFQFELEYIVWTAHQMKTAKQGFQRLWSHIKRTPDLLRLVERPRFGNDDRGIDLKDGRQIRFMARGGGSGLGFTADLVILDEALMLDSNVMADLLPTLSAVPNPQIWYTSSAPRENSEQLHSVRARGLKGDDPRLAFFEWSVEPGADPLSEESWAIANPGYPHRIDREAIEAEWNEFNAGDDPSKFKRERLGVPDDPIGEGGNLPNWSACGDEQSVIASHHMWAIATSPDRKWSTIGVAGRRADNALHVATHYRRGGTDWVVDEAVKFWEAAKVPVRIWKSGPEASFIALLRERGVGVVEVSTAEVTAELRVSSDGASVWSQRLSSVEITPLVAVTVALGGVPLEVKRPPRVYSLSKGR
jgi:hypothetical protein